MCCLMKPVYDEILHKIKYTSVRTLFIMEILHISIKTFHRGQKSKTSVLPFQTYGSGNLKRVGIILQQGILILLLSCFPCWAFLINTESLLRLAQQNPEVHSNSNHVLCLGVSCRGSAWANTISLFSLTVFLYSYIRWKKLHVETWSGWSQECLQEWGSFMRLAIPSMLMLCIEWWTFEIGSFLSGLISKVALGSQSILYELSIIAYMFPLGYGVAVNVRVGNALGAGNTEQAKKTCKVAVMCTAILVMSVVLALKNKIAYIFTTDPYVINYLGFFGIVKGAGKQKIGAICNLTGYYIIGLPIGVSLMFAAHMGFWIGLLVCVFTQSIFFFILVFKFDWKLLTEEVNGFCFSDFIKLPDRVPYTVRAFVADVTTIQ
uniref:Multidrug and toxin extrusion protein 1 n=1 Tax=Erpetoichthys calabaricus TaxID=27687 RepID=A0A8C4S1J6_ERPCA